MYSDENKSFALAKTLNEFDLVIIDTCSLMEDSFPEWMDILANAKDYRLNSQTNVYVLGDCLEELKKHKANRDNPEAFMKATRAMKIITEAKKKKELMFLENKKKGLHPVFADRQIYVKVSEERSSKRILIITQDKDLATDLNGLNNLQSQRGYPAKIMKLSGKAELVINKGTVLPNKRTAEKPAVKPTPAKALDKEKKAEKPAQEPKKPASPKARHVGQTEQHQRLLSADSRLHAVMSNSTYPKEKKIADIKQQLEALRNVPENNRKNLPLLLPETKLKELLGELEGKPSPAPKPAIEKPAAPKPEPKPAQEKKLWYEQGETIRVAVDKTATHYGLMFRFHGIPYMPLVHGPLDLTDRDLNAIVEELSSLIDGPGKRVSTEYKNLVVYAEIHGTGYRAWIDIQPVEAKPSVPEPKPEPTPKQPKPKSSKPKAEAAKPKEEAAKPKAEPKKKPAKKEEPKKDEAEFGNPRLVVMAPVPEKTEKKDSPSDIRKRILAAHKDKPKEKPKKDEVPQEKKEEKPAAPKKKAAPKTEKAPKAEPEKTPLEMALAAEKILLADINNPKVTLARKQREVDQQIELIRALDETSRQKLRLQMPAILEHQSKLKA